ncbi:MAG TPA: 1-acyl-sn-glycerol-3-phosphate acyltransferase, partial [Rhodoglobus sp.]|nr:1-acyl-sn-glycerol-3-phosphate acyltransferase [Rhodoglobus sp.]
MAKARGEKTLGWRILAGIVIPILLVLGRYTFRNSERVPRTGPVIITPNHYSNIDPLVSAYAVWRTGRVTRFLAKASLFKVPVFGAILRGTGQIPVQRAGANAGRHWLVRGREPGRWAGLEPGHGRRERQRTARLRRSQR